jgi:hypothetical protein
MTWRRHVRQHYARGERGTALLTVLTLAFVLMLLATLILDLSGKEMKMTAARRIGAQSLYLAEGGAASARAALLAFMGADPVGCIGCATIDPTLSGTTLNGWYANGVAASQNAFGVFDYIVLDGQRFTLGVPLSTDSVSFQVNWGLAYPHLKLQTGAPVSNSLGSGTYTATLTITRRLKVDPFLCPSGCYILSLGNDTYENFYTFAVISDAQSALGRRRVLLSGPFSVKVQRTNFAKYALFTDTHLTPWGSPIWFTNRTTFDGPVHTNGEFRFAFFPQFGTPDPLAPPCNPSRIASSPLTSVSGSAWFNNLGSPVELAANENVVSGVRRDAPVMPGCGPTPDNNPPANFSRGVSSVPMPTNPFSQKGVAVGRDPNDTSLVTNQQIRTAIPELAPGCPPTCAPVPAGIYIPRSGDLSGSMSGGIYVQGNLDSMTLSYSGANAVYTLGQGGQTVTVTVDRTAGQTTITNNAWAAPQTRTFSGVPKGFQGPGNPNAMIVYTEGNILSLKGTLGQNEQANIVASGSINITDHLVYQVPPVVTDPTSNPTNVLGLYSSGGDITIGTSAPDDVTIHAVMMAGSAGIAYNSSVNVTNYNVGNPRGQVHLIGGIIEKYYGPFGTFNPVTGDVMTGYGRDFKYDRRMSRGFSPPYFPTINLFEVVQGRDPLAGTRPTWREGTP